MKKKKKKFPGKCEEIMNDFNAKLESEKSFQIISYYADETYRKLYDWISFNMKGRQRGETRKSTNSTILNRLMYWVLNLAIKESSLSEVKLGYGDACVINLYNDNGTIRHEDKAIDASVYIELETAWMNMGQKRKSKKLLKIPLIGIESKHYKDLPMFDSIWATQKQLSWALPFTKYIGVSSIRAMNKKSLELRSAWKTPPKSIFVLKDIDRDSKKWPREIEASIDPTMLEDLFRATFNHLNSLRGKSLDIKADMGLYGNENYNTIQHIDIK